MEVWKDIKGYENKYQVSNYGNVRSLNFERKKICKNIKPIIKSTGYYVVTLSYKQCLIHRLVANAFLPNPSNKPVIDHINTIKSDNNVDNLRWSTVKENVNNPISKKLRMSKVIPILKGKYGIKAQKHKRVSQYSLDGKLIKIWDCMSDAWRHYHIDSAGITRTCMGIQKTSGGFIWKYT